LQAATHEISLLLQISTTRQDGNATEREERRPDARRPRFESTTSSGKKLDGLLTLLRQAAIDQFCHTPRNAAVLTTNPLRINEIRVYQNGRNGSKPIFARTLPQGWTGMQGKGDRPVTGRWRTITVAFVA
jgi:hypothetical protein